jgi:hexosaminidase
MSRPRQVLALLAFAILLGPGVARPAHAARASWVGPKLLPMPQEIRPRGAGAQLDSSWVVFARAPEDRGAADLLVAEARECFRWQWYAMDSVYRKSKVARIELRAVPARPADPPLYVAQGYRITVEPRHVVIEGVTPLGRFYGVQTLRQLMRASKAGALEGLAIRDFPSLEWRGVSDDLARGQVSTMADFRELIRQLAFYKINLYQFTIEDLSGLDSPGGVAAGPTTLTRTDLLQLAVEGLRNHVVIAPIFQTLGHDERLRTLGEEMRRASSARGAPHRLEPDQPGAIEFVSGLAGRLVQVTRAPFVGLGGDEWPALADTANRGSPGARTAALAYGDYLGAIAGDLSRRFGCRSMVYGDVVLQWPAAAESLPRDLIVVDWHYDQRDSVPSLRQLASLGFGDVMVSPGIWNWTAFYPNYARAMPNIAALARAAKAANARGLILSSWGDSGAECLRENNWTGYAFAAAAAWEPVAPLPSEFLPRFVRTYYGIDSSELEDVERLLGWQDLAGVTTVGRVFHHALLVKPASDAWRARMTALRDDMETAEHELREVAGTMRDHGNHVGALSHAIRQFRYLAERELALDLIGRTLGTRRIGELDIAYRESLREQLERLHEAARALAYEYPQLWRASNRGPASPFIMDRLANQVEMVGRLRDLARSGRLVADRSYSELQAGRY